MSRRALSLALRLAISIGLLALVALVIAEPRDLVATISRMSGTALLGALLLTAGDRLLMAVKWRLLLLARGIPLPLWTAVRAYFASSFAGLFLPVTLGADAVRVFATRAFGLAEVTASIAVERTLGALSVMSVALVSCAIVAETLADFPIAPAAVAAALIVGLVGVAFPLSLRLTSRWATRGAATSTLGRRLSAVAAAYGAYATHPGTLVVFFCLSVVESLLPAMIAYVVALGLGLHVTPWLFIATMPIALSVARLPISLGGFGVQEVSFVYLAGLFGLPTSDAVATMLIADAVLVLTLLPAAFDVAILRGSRQTS